MPHGPDGDDADPNLAVPEELEDDIAALEAIANGVDLDGDN